MSQSSEARSGPAPFEVGSTVTVAGRSFTIQAEGPAVASRWGLDARGAWELLKMPTKYRPAEIIPAGLPGLSHAGWVQQALERAEAIRRGVAVEGRSAGERVIHASADCPQAVGRRVDSGLGLNRAARHALATALAREDDARELNHSPSETYCACIGQATLPGLEPNA